MAKKIKAEIVGTPITREQIAVKTNVTMIDLHTSAESLKEYMNIFKQAGFFELEIEILLARHNGNSLLFDKNGNLIERYEVFNEILRSSSIEDRTITPIKAASKYNLSNVDEQIDSVLEPLSKLAASNKRALAEKREHIIMIVNETKQLTSGRQ